MRVEIELSDEEAAYLRKHVVEYEQICLTTDGRILARLNAALPRPIQVGDTVRTPSGWTYRVLAILDGQAWVYALSDEVGGTSVGGTYNTYAVELLTRAAGAPIEEQTP